MLSSVSAGAAACLLLQPSPVRAGTSGLWIDNASSGGLWGATGNWNNGVIASGADAIATFNTPGAANTVNLDSSYTLGGINFNTTSTSLTWNISNNGVSTNTLTLATSTGVPTINVATLGSIQTISANIAGTQGFTKSGQGALLLTGSNTYSGVTTLNSTTSSTGSDLYLGSNNALGTSSLYIDPGASNNLRVLLNAGVVIPNNITINTSRAAAGANSSIMTNGNIAGAGLGGSITINSKAGSGGHISGPSDSSLTNFLTITGPIYLSAAYNASSSNLTNTGGNGVLIRSGNVIFSGGGSYFRAEVRSGELRDGATNGIATNAYLDLAGNANGNPLAFGDLDLAGFNQTLVGIQNQLNNTTIATITNSNTSSPSVLTLAPVPASNAGSGSLVFTAGAAGMGTNATLTDSNTAGAYLSIVINGDPAGLQTFNTPNSSYHGSTTLTSGTLAVDSLANGGSNSAIGASSNAAANLVFNGGILKYTGSSVSTDRDWTTNSTASFNIVSSGTTLTMTSGGGLGGNGSGGMTKLGAGTFLFSGVNNYTGPTVVSAGALLIDGSLAAGSAVSVVSGATLGGTGTVAGTVTPAAGGIVSPGDPSNNSGVGTLTVGALNLSTGSVLKYELTGGSGNDEINVTNLNILSGASLDLYVPGTTTTFSANGTYALFDVTGAVSGSLNSLSIATPAAGKAYSLVNNSGVIDLTISSATTIEWNDSSGNNLWSTGGNWIGGTPPNGVGQTALFGSNLSGTNGVVTLTSSQTVSGVVFNNSGVSYSIGGSGSLIVNNGVAAASLDVFNGSHSINVPVTLGSATAMNTTNSTDVLTIAGNISGSNPVTVTGPGTVTLTGVNSFTSTSVTNSTLNVGAGTTGTLGTGPITLVGGAAVNFNSNVNYNFGQAITGSGSITQSGSNILSVGAISGVTTVNVSGGSLVGTSIAQSAGINVTGTGSLTASGAVTGAGKLTVNTSGSVLLSGTNTYSGGTEVDGGTLTLNSTAALPAASALAVNGGTLDLHGNSISINNVLDLSGSTGVITNSVAATTATINFSADAGNYNIYAAINDGPTGGKIALTDFIDNTATSQDGVGNQYALLLNASSNYSGGTTVSKQSIAALATDALGTGPVTLTLNDSSTNNTRLYVAGGATLPNNITIAQPNPYAGYGAIQYYNGSTGSATLTGTITQQADPFSGGTFFGPTAAGSVLNINGPIYTTGTATTISVRGGNIGFGGGGSYPNLFIYGNVVVNAPNGIATNAVVNFPQGAPTLDLTGFNQSIAGLTTTGASGLVTNSSATPATLSVISAAGSNYTNGTLTGNLSLVSGGAGTLMLAGSNTYTGSTTITGGQIQLGSVAQPAEVLPSSTALSLNASGASLDLNGDQQQVASLTGAAGTQVILGGGTLIVGDSTLSTTFAGSITDSGGASNLTGGNLVKQGSGNLTLSGSNTYLGSTTVNAGTLTLAGASALPSGTNLNINSSANVIVSNLGSAKAIAVGTLTIGSGGKLDLNNNALVVESGTLLAINALVASGYNAGQWNGGTGIISSAASTNASHLTALGVIQDSTTGSPTGPVLYTSLDGQSSLTAGDVLVKYAYYGDTNLDGKVDGLDYSRIDSAYIIDQSYLAANPGGANLPATGWFNGDFNYDGAVDGSDYTLMDNAFNTQGAQLLAEIAAPTAEIAGAAESSSVPEPASLGLFGIVAAGLLGRRNPRGR